MPAGDAGLEQDSVTLLPGAEQDERERILTTLRQYGAASGEYVHPWYVPALFDALAYLVENTPMAQAARIQEELDAALIALTDEFNAGRSGPSGLRAQGIAHVRQARLILWGGQAGASRR